LIDEIRRQLSEKSAAEFDLQQSIEALKAEQNLALAKAAADARELSRIEAMSLAEKTLERSSSKVGRAASQAKRVGKNREMTPNKQLMNCGGEWSKVLNSAG